MIKVIYKSPIGSFKTEVLEVNNFPDNTLLLRFSNLNEVTSITWNYENDAELFTLICLRRHLGAQRPKLYLPYVPHARMDRVKSDTDVFTLKYFCEVINSLDFSEVIVRDVHSNVALALLDRVVQENIIWYVNNVLHSIDDDLTFLTFFYPDEGAMKRYSAQFNYPYAFGIKKRDWNTGKIQGLDIVNGELVKGKNVLIIDDICSYGGTFLHSAKALKEAGAEHIYLYVTHCEQSVFKGEMYDSGLIDHIFTTDSIMFEEKEKITIV